MKRFPTYLLFVATLVICAAAPSTAQSIPSALDEQLGDWAVIENTDYGTVSLDTTRVEAHGDNVYHIRTRWNFARPLTSVKGQPYRSSVAVRAINCQSDEMAILAYANLDGERLVHAERRLYPANWSTIKPGSSVERIAKRTCELGNRSPRVTVASAGDAGS